MNQFYSYDNIDLWYAKPKEQKIEPALRLARRIGDMPVKRGLVDTDPAYLMDRDEAKKLPGYHYKAGCLNIPEVVDAWKSKGISYESRELGATRWIAFVPAENRVLTDRKLPLLVVFHRDDYNDPFWAMKTLDIFKSYNDNAAAHKDHVIIYVVLNNASEAGYAYSTMISEALQVYSCDKSKVYFDLSSLVENNAKLADIPGFVYLDDSGKPVENPDSLIENVFGIPVINMSMRWFGGTHFRLNSLGAQDGTMDTEWTIHTETGRKLMEARAAMNRFKSPTDPEAWAYWQKMGLKYESHFTKEERWVTFAPLSAFVDTDKKLPLVAIFHEVGVPNDQGILTGFSDYRTYCEIAAQGDCIVLFFALESPELNDLLYDIIKEAEQLLPIDPSRIYVTGHSHNGHYTQEFMRRHPDMVAAGAPLGNSPGLPTPAVSHEAVVVDDGRAELMETMDMPCVVIAGCSEVGCMYPLNKPGHAYEPGIVVEGHGASVEGHIEIWNRRLKASRCPEQSSEAILAAEFSPNKANRALGVPSDRAETLYIDGFEHYVADFKNLDGKYHFRIVGVQNASHMVLPSKNICAWNFMRRFARDRVTGEVIELL